MCFSNILFIFTQIYFKKKKTGGISFNSTVALTHVDEKLCYQILHEYKIHNAEVSSSLIYAIFLQLAFPKALVFCLNSQVLFREDATVDDLIDVIEGNRKYMKCVYVYNKIDVIGIDDVDKLARQPNSVVISCNLKVGFNNTTFLLHSMFCDHLCISEFSKDSFFL